jgi:5-methylcytosine-specific restriction endonuclease McrA
MDLHYSFDPAKWYLGTPCKNGHRWPGTGLSLRRNYKGAAACAGCSTNPESELPWLFRFIDLKSSGVPFGHKLGKLCSEGHSWHDTGYTLRRHGHCITCQKDRKSSVAYKAKAGQWRKQNKNTILEKAKQRYKIQMQDPIAKNQIRKRKAIYQAQCRQKNGRQCRAKGLEFMFLPAGYSLTSKQPSICKALIADGHLPEIKILWPLIKQIEEKDSFLKKAGQSASVAELVMIEQRRHWNENPEQYKDFCKHRARLRAQWRQLTDPQYRFYHRQKSKRRKAQMRNSIAIQLSGKDIKNRFAEFAHQCAYCDCAGDLHIEHVVPISKGGGHGIGNIVPACKRCNFSKRDHEVESWYRQQEWFTEKRWRKICVVLGWKRS